MDKIQANLKPETVQRIALLANKPVTRGIDKMINKCLDDLQNGIHHCSEKTEEEVKSESDVE